MMEEVRESVRQVNADKVKCKSCGAEMNFDPASGYLTCPYCGGTQSPGQTAEGIASHDYVRGGGEQAFLQDTFSVHCDNCGATVTVDQSTMARVCLFCGSPLIIQPTASKAMIPDGVLPFAVSQESAVKAFKLWIRGKFFSPRTLRSQAKMQNLSGVYIPHFSFDCHTFSTYSAEAGTHYYETEWVTVEQDGKQVQEQREVQRTRWEPVSGTYQDTFLDRLVNASKNVDRKLIKLKFSLGGLKPFTKDYLSGFFAENSSISKEDCWSEAQKNITESLEHLITDQIHADEVRGLTFSTDYSDVRYKYVLLPVWVSVYTFKGKLFKFMINGQTGEIKGQAPVSALRVAISILLTVGVPGLLYYFNHTVGIIAFIVAVVTLLILANKKPKDPGTNG